MPSEISIRLAPSFHETETRLEHRELNQIENNVQEGYVHIILVGVRGWTELKKKYELDCRVIRVSVPAYPPEIGWPEFEATLEKTINFERRWFHDIRPTDARGPLFLPLLGFRPEKKCEGFWDTCNCYGDEGRLTKAKQLLQAVHEKHRRSSQGTGGYWQDIDDRTFSIDPTGHGQYPEQRRGVNRFRFCALVPPGFHYDVVHARNKSFNLIGKDMTHKKILRANIDSWGSVRLP
jgi:hypothetical protein